MLPVGRTLDDIVNGSSKITEPDALRNYFLSIIAAQHQELLKAKASVEDFRAVHNLGNIYEKGGTITALLDPVVNNEILHLKRLLREKEDELASLKKERQFQEFSTQSSIGKELVKRCELLLTENEELGRIVLQSQVQPLTLDLFKEREATKVLKNQLVWMHQYNAELEAENEHWFKKHEEQQQEITKLRKEKELAQRSEEKRNHPRGDSPRRISAPSPSGHTLDVSSTKGEHSRREDKKHKDERARNKANTEPEKTGSWYSSSLREEIHDVDRRTDRLDSRKRKAKTEIEKEERFAECRDDRHSIKKIDLRESPRKDDRSRHSAVYRSRSERRIRDEPRDGRSPYRRERYRSPRPHRKH